MWGRIDWKRPEHNHWHLFSCLVNEGSALGADAEEALWRCNAFISWNTLQDSLSPHSWGEKKPLIKLCADALAVGIHAALLTEDSYFRLQAQPHLPMSLTMAIYNSWVFVEHILEVVCSLQLCGMFLSESKAARLNRRITEGLSEYYNSWDLIQFCFLLWFTQAGFCSWLM